MATWGIAALTLRHAARAMTAGVSQGILVTAAEKYRRTDHSSGQNTDDAWIFLLQFYFCCAPSVDAEGV